MFILACSRLAAHNITEHQVHVDKWRRGVHVLRGDRRSAHSHIMDQRLRSIKLQERQPKVILFYL